jgi:hypothetical protein
MSAIHISNIIYFLILYLSNEGNENYWPRGKQQSFLRKLDINFIFAT